MLLNFFKPFQSILEGLLSSDVISKKDTMRTAIEDPCDRTEWFLTCCVPYLKFNYFFLNLNDESPELNSYCYLMLNLKVVIHNASKKAALTDAYKNYMNKSKIHHTCISDDNELVEQVLMRECFIRNNCIIKLSDGLQIRIHLWFIIML